MNLTDTTILSQSGSEGNGNEEVLYISHVFKSKTSQPDAVWCYT